MDNFTPVNPEQNEALNNYRFHWLERQRQRHTQTLTVQNVQPVLVPNRNQLNAQVNEMDKLDLSYPE